MSTISPEAMCGAIERPVTCGARMKNANARRPSSASCALAPAMDRQCNGRSTRPFSRRRSQNPRVAQRPEDQECVSREVRGLTFARSACVGPAQLCEAPNVRILRIIPVVAHHEVAIRRNAIERGPLFAGRNVRYGGIQGLKFSTALLHEDVVVANVEVVKGRLRDVGSAQWLAVEDHRAVADLQGVSRPADDALDEIVGA